MNKGCEGFSQEIEEEIRKYFEVKAKNIMKKDNGKRISDTFQIYSIKNKNSKLENITWPRLKVSLKITNPDF